MMCGAVVYPMQVVLIEAPLTWFGGTSRDRYTRLSSWERGVHYLQQRRIRRGGNKPNRSRMLGVVYLRFQISCLACPEETVFQKRACRCINGDRKRHCTPKTSTKTDIEKKYSLHKQRLYFYEPKGSSVSSKQKTDFYLIVVEYDPSNAIRCVKETCSPIVETFSPRKSP